MGAFYSAGEYGCRVAVAQVMFQAPFLLEVLVPPLRPDLLLMRF